VAQWDNPTVSITVENGTTIRKYEGIPWSINMVALDAMKMAKGIEFTGKWNRGLSQWLITSINSVDNLGVWDKSWLLCVNGFMAGIGAGSYVVGPNASIKWVFDVFLPSYAIQQHLVNPI
jgi:hypothetical protein